MLRILVPIVLASALAAGAAVPAAAAVGPCRGHHGPRCHRWHGRVTFVADGDTVDVDIAHDGRGPRRIRLTGINAMELTRYSHDPARRRGECHGVAAADRLEHLLRRGHMRVRLSAQDPASHSGRRLRRQVSARVRGRWVDVGRALVAGGFALWMPNGVEWAWNRAYDRLSRRAAAAGRRLWNPRGCGTGPSAGADLALTLQPDAPGADGANVNGEWARIADRSAGPVPLAGWWFRDSALRRYTFPAGAAIPAGGSVRLEMGRGADGGGVFHWGLPAPPFENPTHDARGIGDGGYLFDPRGNLRAWAIYG